MLPSLTIEYSPEFEIERVGWMLRTIATLREHKYPLTLPPGLAGADAPSDAMIRDAVAADFDTVQYENVAKTIRENWPHLSETCTQSLFSLFPTLARDVTVRLTRYGVGGSYRAPATIITNIALRTDPQELQKTLLHEIIHLGLCTIAPEDALDHWAKERLVDRVSEKVNPTYARTQKIPVDVSHVDTVFDASFPDIQAIIAAAIYLRAVK